ncbi:MAG: hypothetical protein R3E36_07405 [Nitrosomonas sp.]|nr:hypothetical protein [Nitrosomonas sp.]
MLKEICGPSFSTVPTAFPRLRMTGERPFFRAGHECSKVEFINTAPSVCKSVIALPANYCAGRTKPGGQPCFGMMCFIHSIGMLKAPNASVSGH